MKAIAAALVAGVVAGAASAAAPGVSLQIKPKAIEYGQTVTLKGRISSGRAGAEVLVHAHSCHFTKAAVVRKLKTGKHGSYSFRIGPTLRTAYSVSWAKRTSRQISVGVAPQMTLYKSGANGFLVGVTAGNGATFEGKHALLQRLVRGKWRTIGTASLTLTSDPNELNATSTGTVKVHVPHGAKLRAALPLSQARPCYLSGTSGVLVA